jgi:O-antigen/teichoic acid export membrane protein
LGGAALALLAQILAARMLRAGLAARAGLRGNCGQRQLICRYVAKYRRTQNDESLAGLIRAALATVLGIGAALALAGMALVAAAPFGFARGDLLLASLALSAIPLLAPQDYLDSIARGLDRPVLGIGPAFLVRHLAIIAGLLALDELQTLIVKTARLSASLTALGALALALLASPLLLLFGEAYVAAAPIVMLLAFSRNAYAPPTTEATSSASIRCSSTASHRHQPQPSSA